MQTLAINSENPIGLVSAQQFEFVELYSAERPFKLQLKGLFAFLAGFTFSSVKILLEKYEVVYEFVVEWLALLSISVGNIPFADGYVLPLR